MFNLYLQTFIKLFSPFRLIEKLRNYNHTHVVYTINVSIPLPGSRFDILVSSLCECNLKIKEVKVSYGQFEREKKARPYLSWDNFGGTLIAI